MIWKSAYLYYALAVLTGVLVFVSRDTVEVPMFATMSGFFLMLMVAADQSWKAFKRCGRAAIITTLKPSDGGHSTIHPADISIASSQSHESDSKIPNFAVFATGGFVHGGVEWQGEENFFVCPPEHIEQTGAALICRTRFRKVDFEELPDFVQGELLKLRFFNPRTCALKDNLWFGITSTIDGTSSTKFLQEESNFLDQTELINKYKKNLKDKDYESKPQRIIINPADYS